MGQHPLLSGRQPTPQSTVPASPPPKVHSRQNAPLGELVGVPLLVDHRLQTATVSEPDSAVGDSAAHHHAVGPGGAGGEGAGQGR